MSGFRLLAIRPLPDCDETYLKGLDPNGVFSFYSNYHYLNKKGEPVKNTDTIEKVVVDKDDSFNIYESELNKTSINISALVGKNGSGKSTLLELFYVTCYAIALEKGIVPNTKYFSAEYAKTKESYLYYIIGNIMKVQSSLNVDLIYAINSDFFSISFMIKGMLKGEGYWAIAKFEGENLEISINGLSFAQEKSFINSLKKDTRNTIGMWIDETPFMCSSMILLEENEEVILETKYRDNSISKEKFKPTKLDIGTRYNKSERDIHGEYFIVYNNGILKYFSEEGEVFKELYPFNSKIN